MTRKARTPAGDWQVNRAHGRRGMITGSPWSYWPVYVGVSLAILLVTAGVTLAVQSVQQSHTSEDSPVWDEVAAIPPPYSADSEAQTDVRENMTSPALEGKDRQAAASPPEVTAGKLMPEMPLKAVKMAPELITPAQEPQVLAKVEPVKEQSEPLKLAPEPSACAAKLPTVANEPPVCSTNLPTAAQNDPTYRTAIHFVSSPTAAARDALKEDKLVFVLHVSGNFEDPQFT